MKRKLSIFQGFTGKELSSISNTSLLHRKAKSLYDNGQCNLLSQSDDVFEFSVDDEFNDFTVKANFETDEVVFSCTCKSQSICHHKLASIFQLENIFVKNEKHLSIDGKKYTKEGMIKRAMSERTEKARKATYSIHFNDNIYGEHVLFNESANQYRLTFRDIKNEKGHCTCPDYKTNKLGTCKHLIFAFDYLKNNTTILKSVSKHSYPFVEIYLDGLNENKISWFYPHTLQPEIKKLISKYFKNRKYIENEEIVTFINFITESENHKQIYIRDNVFSKIETYFDQETLRGIEKESEVDFSLINATLFDYQKEGIKFATFKSGALIADEMGLGKTIQAIGIAINKKKFFGFKRTLIICPASLKSQWKSEIEKFSTEKAIVVNGSPNIRHEIYKTTKEYFTIINYEAVIKDWKEINKRDFDFIILDEAQRIKNYNTFTAKAIKKLNKKHSLVITGTPIENRLIDLYSIMGFVSPDFLTPLWEFSYQHCYFDEKKKDKITGYYNLTSLKEKLNPILIRREKKDVLKELPTVSEIDIPVDMHEEQAYHHNSFSRGVASILAKKYITPYDMQKLMLLLARMRMVCDSTYLIDLESNYSPKLEELKHILFEKLDLKNNNRKIIIFSEWKRMLKIISKMLTDNGINHVELTGDVPVKKRKDLITKFEDNDDCRVFISTEAGGVGLNLQVADTVINFELPWNPAKKNQRIGRIDRIGQQNTNLTVLNLITRGSIEQKIASGLSLKQNLFDGVLSPDNNIEYVDFSQKGRSQFLQQLETVIDDLENNKDEEVNSEIEEIVNIPTNTSQNTEDNIDKINVTEEEHTEEKSTDFTEKEDIEDEHKISAPSEKEEFMKKAEELETVMNNGLGFISGLFKMATGKELSSEEQKIEINKETGEVVMRFKLPI